MPAGMHVRQQPHSNKQHAAAASAPADVNAPLSVQQTPCSIQQQQQQQLGAEASACKLQDAGDAALYQEMCAALAGFNAQTAQQQQHQQHADVAADAPSSSRRAGKPPSRHTAFYAALRSVLQQVLAEGTAVGRHSRLLAAYAWFVRHRPRPCGTSAGLAAALAASLSICPSNPAAATPGGAGAQLQGAAACLSTAGAWQHVSAAAAECSSSSSSSSGSDSDGDGNDTCSEEGFGRPSPSAAGCTGSDGRARATTDVPGHISMGALPSSRFAATPLLLLLDGSGDGGSSGSSSGGRGGTAAAACDAAAGARTAGSAAGWAAMARTQAAVASSVAASMHAFAREQARLEARISRRQELAAFSAAAAAAAAGGGAAGVCVHVQPCAARRLQHVDSQHQPSQLAGQLVTAAAAAAAAAGAASGQRSHGGGSTMTSAAAAAAASAALLAAPNAARAARQAHAQGVAQECGVLAAALGLPSSVVRHALLPLPDVPHMSAITKLPGVVPGADGGARGKQKKKQPAKAVDKQGSSSKQSSSSSSGGDVGRKPGAKQQMRV